MFKKKPQIKNLSSLRSSDRRKLADQIISDYHIQIPTPSGGNAPAGEDAASHTPPVTLSALRSSLLPESTSSARFTTTSGPNATPVSGTIYVGTYPGQDERILWFSYGKDPRLLPTVYTLWQNPGLVPLLHAADFVVEDKLKGGADLMTPGLFKVRSKRWDERAIKGSIVAVAGVSKDTVPVWVGQCEINVSELGDTTRGLKGAAVKGLHWEHDEIWNWSPVAAGGRPAPPAVEGWEGLSGSLDDAVQHLDLEDDDEDEDDQKEGGVALDSSNGEIVESAGLEEPPEDGSTATTADHREENESDREPTTKEVDDAFYQAFLYAVHTAKNQHQPPAYGFDFPLQPSFLVANMIQPHLRYTNSHFTIKKTSWKNTKRFIKHLDKQLLVKSKDRNGGETVILDIDFNDQQVTNFQPYRIPKPKAKTEPSGGEVQADADGVDSSVGQKLAVQSLYRASSKLVPQLLDSKTTYYTGSQITAALKSYIEANPGLTQGVSVSRNIKFDPFIANNILGSNSSSADLSALRAGEIDRGMLNRRILEDDHLCIPSYVILRNGQTYDAANNAPKPKSGVPPKVQIAIERRSGSKFLTKISNIEPYFINPLVLAPEIQKKCAGSASVGQLVGGKPGTLEITVQGDQRNILVTDILAKRGVQGKWIEIVDKALNKKKK